MTPPQTGTAAELQLLIFLPHPRWRPAALTRFCLKRCRLLALLLIVVPAGAMAAPAVDPVAEARQAFEALQLKEAAALITQAVQQGRRDAELFYLQTRIALLQGRLEDAADAATRCERDHREHTLCLEARGESKLISLILGDGVFRRIGAARAARKALHNAISSDPDNLRARLLLVRFYTLAPWILGGSKAKAQEQVEACRARSEAWGYEAQALYALGTGDTEGAVEGFARANALRPDERDPALYLAKAYLADDQPAAAVATLQQLVERYPQFAEAWLEMGRIAAADNLYSARGMAALQHYLANAANESDQRRAEAARLLAQLYVSADRPEDALEVLNTARKTNPDDQRLKKEYEAVCTEHPSRCS